MKKSSQGKSSDYSDLPLFAKNNTHDIVVTENNVVCMRAWKNENKKHGSKTDFIAAYINLANKIKW